MYLLVAAKIAPVFLEEQRIYYKMVYNTILLGPANHQELHFKIKIYNNII